MMNTTIINGITIHIEGDIKYRRQPNHARAVVCMVDNCSKFAVRKTCGCYCTQCLNDLCGNDTIKRKKLIEESNKKLIDNRQKFKSEQEAELEKSKIIIDGVEIYIIDSKKYKKNSNGSLVPACMYDECTKYPKEHGDEYCYLHINGTDPNSIERKAEQEQQKKEYKVKAKDAVKVGDSTELWVLNKLKSIKHISEVTNTGYTGSKYDILFKLPGDNEFRGIQVKTLVKQNRKPDSYKFTIQRPNYTSNTLFIGVNKDRTRFILAFFKDFKNKDPYFNFSNSKSDNRSLMYTSYSEFITKLGTMLRMTGFCDKNCYSEHQQRENDSLTRLSDICNQHSLEFERVEENGSIIDCKINDFNIQHKTSNYKSSSVSYTLAIAKRNGNRDHSPYSHDDGIDFFVFEIIDHKHHFYIVPIEVLIEKGYIHTNDKPGKCSICIPNPKTGDKSHWIYSYLNNFSQLNR